MESELVLIDNVDKSIELFLQWQEAKDAVKKEILTGDDGFISAKTLFEARMAPLKAVNAAFQKATQSLLVQQERAVFHPLVLFLKFFSRYPYCLKGRKVFTVFFKCHLWSRAWTRRPQRQQRRMLVTRGFSQQLNLFACKKWGFQPRLLIL